MEILEKVFLPEQNDNMESKQKAERERRCNGHNEDYAFGLTSCIVLN